MTMTFYRHDVANTFMAPPPPPLNKRQQVKSESEIFDYYPVDHIIDDTKAAGGDNKR